MRLSTTAVIGAYLSCVRDSILKNEQMDGLYNEQCKIQKKRVHIKMPVRVNFAGGWTDTPPYCQENGGAVLNAAIKLKEKFPIEATVTRLDKPLIIFSSTDCGAYQEYREIEDLQNCSNPYDTFALHKAVLIACGIVPYKMHISVQDLTNRLGGGIHLSTCVKDIPRGSGLGTSSILVSACVKAIFAFLGEPESFSVVCDKTMCTEQIMSTGGGWQDQAGALLPGLKILSSDPAISQKVSCNQISVSDDLFKELNERFALIYTGQRRLARNLLWKIMGCYVEGNEKTLNVLAKIGQMPALMCGYLENGDIDKFAELMSKHWELSKQLDDECTNTCIDQILLSLDDLIDGKMICGAGGGGFLQVLMKKGVTKKDLSDRLYDIFAQSGVEVWDSQFLRESDAGEERYVE